MRGGVDGDVSENDGGGEEMKEIIANIFLGAVGSIVATIVLYLCSSVYRIGYKKKVMYYLELARNYNYQIRNYQTFVNDYDKIIPCVERMHECIFAIHDNILLLSKLYAPKNKKLIQTLLYDIQRRCERAMFQTVGYHGDAEIEARLNCIQKLFNPHKESSVEIELEVIAMLLKTKNIKETATKLKTKYVDLKQIKEMVDCRSLKKSCSNEIIQNEGLTEAEFNEIFKAF